MDGNHVDTGYSGVFKALVVDNAVENYIEYKKSRGYTVEDTDPKNYASMIRIRIPQIHGTSESGVPDDELPWASPSMPYNSSTSRGLLGILGGNNLVPDIGSIVWVTYEGGNRRLPVYIGVLYSGNKSVEEATDGSASESSQPASSSSLASTSILSGNVLSTMTTTDGSTITTSEGGYSSTLSLYISEGAQRGISDTQCLLYYSYMRTVYGKSVDTRLHSSANISLMSLQNYYEIANELAGSLNVTLKDQNRRYYELLTASSVVAGKFIQWVVPGKTRVSSKYGPRTPPTKGASSYHKGIDISGNGQCGAAIVAVDSGVITYAQFNKGGFGNCVIMKLDSKIDGKDVYTLCAHGQSIPEGIKVGTRVKRGQTVLILGNTGTSTGPHLHFQVMLGYHTGTTSDQGVNTVDPLQFYDASTIK